ncbi:protein PHLOEM PROTEIN 2-LIKE A9 [Cannabis sativa]|jgi:hypothetical protein|uniref:Uncharacterized protein n=1 Tax=Cannabis sativa TaxID=3483 RepID=A0A803QHS8_CANSA|nr:protein PHLOEM PROTEIN 2-LIKE A9 [Cannabis sativa]
MSTTKAHHDADTTAIEGDRPDTNEIIFYPRGLNIVWGNDSRYWRIPNEAKPNNGKNPTAELIQVSWLEVTGSTASLETGKKYKIQFFLSLKSDAFGWNGCQVYLMAKIGKRGKYKWSKIVLKDQNTTNSGQGTPFPSEEFVIEVPDNVTDADKKLYFGLYEVWSGKWKGGLQIHKAVVSKVIN